MSDARGMDIAMILAQEASLRDRVAELEAHLAEVVGLIGDIREALTLPTCVPGYLQRKNDLMIDRVCDVKAACSNSDEIRNSKRSVTSRRKQLAGWVAEDAVNYPVREEELAGAGDSGA